MTVSISLDDPQGLALNPYAACKLIWTKTPCLHLTLMCTCLAQYDIIQYHMQGKNNDTPKCNLRAMPSLFLLSDNRSLTDGNEIESPCLLPCMWITVDWKLDGNVNTVSHG